MENTTITTQDMATLMAELTAAKAENAKLKAKAGARAVRGMSLRVSEKGALSVYGLGRFPQTLYREQWEKLLSISDEIKAFIAANDATLVAKADKLTLVA